MDFFCTQGGGGVKADRQPGISVNFNYKVAILN